MCRYALQPYKDHFACLGCRKSFKHFLYGNARWRRLEWMDREVRCPQCRHPMVNMGRDFEAPRRADVNQWRKIELLHRAGIHFHSCGCGAGYRPATLRETRAGLRQPITSADLEKLSFGGGWAG